MLIALKWCPSVVVLKREAPNGAEQVIKRTGGMDKSQEGEYSHLLPDYSLENESPHANELLHRHFFLQHCLNAEQNKD